MARPGNTVKGFEAADWAERNAATMLFSALFTRIFGVKREKDSAVLSSKNCLTGKVFFQRYPSLHALLLGKLQDSLPKSKDMSSSGTLQLYPALYPILLIISRIFPSPSDVVNNPFQLAAFVGPVAACAGNPVLAIRELAAKALVPLLPPADLAAFVGQVMAELTSGQVSSANRQHGLLLQAVFPVRSFVGGSGSRKCKDSPKQNDVLSRWLWKLMKPERPLDGLEINRNLICQ